MQNHVLPLLFIAVTAVAPLPATELHPVEDTAQGREVFELLGAYYADPESALAVVAIENHVQPEHHDPEVRRASVDFLLRVFRQSREDERTGRQYGPPRPGGIGPAPEWRTYRFGRDQPPARAIRQLLAVTVYNAGTEMLPAWRWLLLEEPDPEINLFAARAIAWQTSPEGDALLVAALEQPHPSATVLSFTLGRLARRQPSESTTRLASRLAHHHFSRVRDLARKLLVENEATPPAFEPVAALRGLRPLLSDLARVQMRAIPDDATWAQATVTDSWGDEELLAGWVLESDDKTVRILTFHGTETEVPRASLAPEASLEHTVEELCRLRERYNASGDEDERDELAGRVRNLSWFTAHGADWPLNIVDLQLAAWAVQRGDARGISALLLPVCDSHGDDRELRSQVISEFGNLYESEMIRAFARKRDYNRALQYARHLSDSVFEGYVDQERARKLARQLPRRRGDYRTFKRPTRAEWAGWCEQHSRAEQIRYLCDRLRLMNTEQRDHPGGIHYDDVQYACPLSRVSELEWRMLETLEVINPYEELLELDLKLEELELVFPYLASDDYILAYDLTRFGFGAHNLHRVSWVTTVLLNEASGDRWKWFEAGGETATPDGQARYIEYLGEQIESAPDARYSDALFAELADAENWDQVTDVARRILPLGQGDRLLDELMARRDTLGEQHRLIDLAWLLGRGDHVTTIASWIPELEPHHAIYATCLVLRLSPVESEEHVAARSRLRELLGTDVGLVYCDLIMEDLLAWKDPTLREAAIECLKRDQGHHDGGVRTAQLLLVEGEPAALDFFLHYLQRERASDDHRPEAILSWARKWLFGDDLTLKLDDIPLTRIESRLKEIFHAAQSGHRPIPTPWPYHSNLHEWTLNQRHLRWVRNW